MSDVERLRSRYPTFIYERYRWRFDDEGALCCSFTFRCGEHTYEPRYRFRFPTHALARPALNRAVLNNLAFQLGLAEIPSYWKATCSPTIRVLAGPLSEEQIAFWTTVLTDGMGEFHYKNQTAFSDPGFVSLRSDVGEGGADHEAHHDPLSGYVVPVGGGKDSLLTLDLLNRYRDDVVSLAINPPASTREAIKRTGCSAFVDVQRTLDPHLLELNSAGYLNGHTPFGVVIAFASSVAAACLGRKHIALSNESSADHATVRYGGRTINHQYGKSTELEYALHAYLPRHVGRELHYFSLLRPFNELQIAQGFSRLHHLHDVFRSCNRGRKTDSWCGRCAKCLSTFLVLAPFVGRETLAQAVGGDFLAGECQTLLPSLLSEDADRPFECIATPDELRVILSLLSGERPTAGALAALTTPGPQHLVPDGLYALATANLRPRADVLLSHGAVGVLGLGVEGLSTCRHLLANVPDVDLTAIDDSPEARSRLPSTHREALPFTSSDTSDFDVLFKSPGVAPDHPVVAAARSRSALISSHTALFFEHARGVTIGVTGTKGKSTATSLIAHVLREGGKNARLVGNIGRPCLDAVDQSPDAVYCAELSSFQLEDLRVSPTIAVVLGIFPDHLDRHGTMASYVDAKSSITRYQDRSSEVYFNSDCPEASRIAALSHGTRTPFTRSRPPILGDDPSPLAGKFNHLNLWPAILIARRFGIDDATIASALRSFRPLPGRLETVVARKGIRFVCDIRSTAPEVTVAALEAFADAPVRWLMLGGVDRKQDYRTLLPALAQSAVEHVILFPPTGARIRRVLEQAPLHGRFRLYEPTSMEDAIRYVYRTAPEGPSVCMMSTAAPSNGGLFQGPEDKVEQFTRWATQLGQP